MAKFCPNCGFEIKSEYKFCLNCGIKIESDNYVVPQTSTEETVYPTQIKNQQLQQKKNMKLIFIIIAIILVVVLIIIIFSLLRGSHDSRFVGTWTIQSGGGSTFAGTITFESNGVLKTGYQGIQIPIGKWSIDGNKICFEYELMGSTYPKICSSYSFSNGGNSLTIFDPTGEGNGLILVK